MTLSIFDKKLFNAEVFQGYMDRIPNPNKAELIKSRAIRQRPDLAAAMADNDGGNYITTGLKGLLDSSHSQNYDGSTNLEAKNTATFKHSRVVVGRMEAWTENDFSYDITGGQDFIENVAEQVNEYWDEVDQATIIHILNGVFNMADEEGLKFVRSHTYDVTAKQNSEGVTGVMDGTTLNTGMQKACGDGKSKFSMAIMHSTVATGLENLKVLSYLKYTDANGMERELSIATLNGRIVLVDDGMPTEEAEVTAGVYTVTIGGTVAEGDEITVLGKKTTLDSSSAASVTAAAAAVVATLGTLNAYSVSANAGVITFTEKSGHYGAGAPSASIVSTAGTVAVATSTPAVTNTVYTTYVLGDGAIEYTDCGAKVPYEPAREPFINGGQDSLISRQRKSFAPFGISFTKANMLSLSPSDAELEDGSNWELVNTGASENKEYISLKTIPIARIVSLG